MHYKILIPAVLAAVTGILLIGSGLTGLVISQSCCFGSSCPTEYLCDAAEPHVESPIPVAAHFNLLFGVTLIIASAAAFLTYLHKNK